MCKDKEREFTNISLVDFVVGNWYTLVSINATDTISIYGDDIDLVITEYSNRVYYYIKVQETLYEVGGKIPIDKNKDYILYYDKDTQRELSYNNSNYRCYNACFIEEVD